MESKAAVMQEIFRKLTEKNKDILILVAKSVNIAQEDSGRQHIASAHKMKTSDCKET